MKKNYKTIGIIALAVIVLIYALITYFMGGKKELKKNDNENIFVEEESSKESKAVEAKKDEIVVEIKGEVVKPNIYWLEEGSIIEDLINKAGGVTKEADLSSINRAEELVNHESIVIPNKNESNNETKGEVNIKGSTTKININKASLEELQSLSGIGESKAKSIISYRESNGKFKSIEDLKNVKGIGDKLFDSIKDMIAV